MKQILDWPTYQSRKIKTNYFSFCSVCPFNHRIWKCLRNGEPPALCFETCCTTFRQTTHPKTCQESKTKIRAKSLGRSPSKTNIPTIHKTMKQQHARDPHGENSAQSVSFAPTKKPGAELSRGCAASMRRSTATTPRSFALVLQQKQIAEL